MTYVRMTRPLKRPMRVALTDHLPRVRSVYESGPAECSWPFPSQRIPLDLQLRPRRCDLCRAGPVPTCGWSMSVNLQRHFEASVSSPRDRLELVKPQMRLEMKK